MNEDPDIKCRGYEITLTNKTNGKQAAVKLSVSLSKWVVSAEGYSGYFKDLETAFKEACNHLQYKTKEME